MDILRSNRCGSRSFTCKFELHIINDSKYTDYDLGDLLGETILDSGYDIFDDVVEITNEIADKLYNECFGQFTYIIEVDLTYITTHDYFEGYDEDLKYEYRIIDRYESSYFNEYNQTR